MDDDASSATPSIPRLSKTPSWVMLGFILGALVVWAWPRREPPPRTVVVTQPAATPARPPEPPVLTTIEAVFSQWAEYAVWDEDLTQVALWNSAVGDFAEFYEVRRVGDVYYFRSLPQLTRRILNHGKPPPAECPLRFTETEEQYREWREYGRRERREPVRASLSVPQLTPAAAPRPSVEPVPMLEPAAELTNTVTIRNDSAGAKPAPRPTR